MCSVLRLWNNVLVEIRDIPRNEYAFNTMLIYILKRFTLIFLKRIIMSLTLAPGLFYAGVLDVKSWNVFKGLDLWYAHIF